MQPHHPHQQGQSGDFGIRPDVAAEHAKHRGEDHLGRPAGDKMLSAGNSVREHGVGSTGGHPGKGSGGEIDTELLGLEPLPGRIDDPGTTADGRPNIGGSKTVLGGHIQPSGAAATLRGETDEPQSGGGIANTKATRDSRENDSFASEVSFDEASGEDESEGGGGARN